MTLKFILICAGALGIASCSTKDHNQNSDLAARIYVREYSFDVTNPETGQKIGMREIRDSIFVQPSSDGYQVSNSKWGMNDYDNEGWVSMAHADDRPLPTFVASLDERLNSLTPISNNQAPTLFIDNDKGKLFRNRSRDIEYSRIK